MTISDRLKEIDTKINDKGNVYYGYMHDMKFLRTVVEAYHNTMIKVCPMNEDHAEQVEYEFNRLQAEGKGEGKK